nr:Wadjet anti-phage system protein JetD domain-containing protein [Clostridium beijerinckii]
MKNEPLLNTIFKGFYEKDRRNILIVENLETYWSLNKVLREMSNDIDMLIWGKGCSIESNFRGTILYGVNKNDRIFYFGDIDLSGVDIFLRLKNNFKDFSIMPSTSLYKNLLRIGTKMGIKKSRSQKQIDIDEDRLNIFLNAFTSEVKDKLKAIIKNREYIPQEALNYNELRKAYGNE